MSRKLFRDSTRKRECKISSVQVLIKKIETRPYSIGPRYFREHAKSKWALLPSIARMDYNVRELDEPFTIDQEKAFLNRFKRYVYEFQEKIVNQWEAIFLAKHHDVPVRLLDWTSNPLVALYWAAKCHSEENGAIWVFKPKKQVKKEFVEVFSKKYHDPDKIKGIRVVYPFYTRRMHAQSSFFTIHERHECHQHHERPFVDLGEVSENIYPGKDNDISCGEKWLVPKDNKQKIIKTLHRLGINERTLLPGLDSIGRDILNKELMFPPKKRKDT